MPKQKVPADDVATMAREITLGVKPENSRIEMTPDHQEVWDRLTSEIADIKRRGGIVEIPE